MRLLNTRSLVLRNFLGSEAPPYAALSHTWVDEEVGFKDLQNGVAEHDLVVLRTGYLFVVSKHCVVGEEPGVCFFLSLIGADCVY
jgi:hypothetical protein